MDWRPLTDEEVAIRLKAEPEFIPVQGNASASGDDAFDQEVEHNRHLVPPGPGRCLGLGHGNRDCLMGILFGLGPSWLLFVRGRGGLPSTRLLLRRHGS